MLRKVLTYLFLLFNCLLIFSQASKTDLNNDIIELLEKARSTSIKPAEKITYSKKARDLAAQLKNDSLQIIALDLLANNYYDNKEYESFKKISEDLLKHSILAKDSSKIGMANRYLGSYFLIQQKTDSAYSYLYNAEKIFKNLKDDYNTAKVLLKIAIIQKNEKDFIGSEVTSIEGVELIKPSDDIDMLSYFYNNLGIIYNELGQYSQAIEFHQKSIELKKKFKKRDRPLEESSYNNIAVVYKNDKQYKKALEYFNLILENKDLIKNNPSFYAMVLDNYAHTKFLIDNTEKLPELYFDAKEICDSINDDYNAIAINIHLSEYYNSINKIDSARYYGHQAKDLAKRFHNDDYLKALLNLTEIEEDSLSKEYYKQYIALNDSLIDKERLIRNKFARIRYETKEIEKRNEQITKERLYLLILSIGLLLTIFLTYIVISQRAKNKELKLNQLQQEANEEIYNLMLSQNEKVKEGRAQEKKRISEELHDGILGRLFGTRLSLDSLNNSSSEEAAESRGQYIEELKSIEQEIRKISHDLNSDFVAGSEFFEMIENLVENQTQAYGLNYKLENDNEINWDSVSNKTKINLYRIVQETLQNIYKHAKAKHVDILFSLDGDFIKLEIKDDGEGFDVGKSRKGIGIKNMHSRVAELNGTIKIHSEKLSGTQIIVKVPQ